jgi:DNA end-binding protein Ku
MVLMAARAMWKGTIEFGAIEVPVKLYSAVQNQSVSFRLLDSKKKEPIKQQMVNPETGKVVEFADIKRAYQTDGGELVLLDEEELAELEPEESREIEITRFLPLNEISHLWYDRPYFLGPDESKGEYFALAEAMREQKVEGVARWVMRKKEYVGALRAEGDYLILITLRHAGEVILSSALTPPAGRALDDRELRMARQLVEAMEGEFDIAAYKDEYRARVLDLVEAKAAGKVLKFPKAPAKKEEKSLADVLERSLKAAEKGRASA